jgi:hypothetical protein
MNPQAIVDQFARSAKPRLMDLLKLKVQHVYDPTPGGLHSKSIVEGCTVEVRLQTATQPYRDIERFLAEDKLMGFVINPGLLSIVTAISGNLRGRRLLVTRKVEARDDDRGVVAHLDGFGMRIMMYSDLAVNETQVVWECLYGVG